MDKKIIMNVCKFFENRFPDKVISFEMRCGYFWEWYDRFKSGSPQNYMDADSLLIYKKMREENE